jgi:hypothetical protein
MEALFAVRAGSALQVRCQMIDLRLLKKTNVIITKVLSSCLIYVSIHALFGWSREQAAFGLLFTATLSLVLALLLEKGV